MENIKDRSKKSKKAWNYFVENYLSKLPDNHEVISKQSDYKKMCKRWGIGYLQFISAQWLSWKEMPSEIMSENEWYVYNGVPFVVDMELLVPKFLSEETINGVYVRSYE